MERFLEEHWEDLVEREKAGFFDIYCDLLEELIPTED
jgi:hypothetical protein